MPSGHDPMGGSRFSEKIMLKINRRDHDPIYSDHDRAGYMTTMRRQAFAVGDTRMSEVQCTIQCMAGLPYRFHIAMQHTRS